MQVDPALSKKNLLSNSQISEERYRFLVEGILDYAVFTIDPQGYIESWNLGAVRIKGYTHQEAIGSHFSMLYPEDARKRNEPMLHLKEAYLEGSYHGEGLRRKKNGDLFLADVYIRPIIINCKLVGFAKVVADLGEKNKLIREVDVTRSEIQEIKNTDKMKERFISTLSHDLRSPLAMARLSAEMILRNPTEVESKVRKIVAEIDRADKMIKDLLDVNKLRAGGKLKLNIEEVNLTEIFKDLCADFNLREPGRLLCQHGWEMKGHWDPEGLRRVVENLLSNAFKYGDPDGVVTLSTKLMKDKVFINVHNRGNPIAPEDLPKIFEQFHQTESSERSEKEGWGLGLTLVKGITEAHGGFVKVKSFPLEGTTFTIELPLDSRPSSNRAF